MQRDSKFTEKIDSTILDQLRPKSGSKFYNHNYDLYPKYSYNCVAEQLSKSISVITNTINYNLN